MQAKQQNSDVSGSPCHSSACPRNGLGGSSPRGDAPLVETEDLNTASLWPSTYSSKCLPPSPSPWDLQGPGRVDPAGSRTQDLGRGSSDESTVSAAE